MSSPVTIERAAPTDQAAVETLLRKASLPLDGLTAALSAAVVARDVAHRLVGCAALEVYGEVALLRSVAVDPAHQGHGLGSRLLDEVSRVARERGVSDLYLLTTTAAAFFAARGFARVDRDAVPEAIRTTAEFTSICPASATVMMTQLRHRPSGTAG